MPGNTVRPYKLPTIQIDTWNASARSTAHSADAIARKVCIDRVPLLVHSLIKNKQLHQIKDFANMVLCTRQPLCVEIKCGQVYMHSNWRVRYGDMDSELQRAVLREPSGVQAAFIKHYNAHAVESMLMQAIGPARAEGTRSYLLIGERHDPRPEQ